MDKIIYYSRNAKKPPFEVTVDIDGRMVFVNCNCELGQEKKICRHKINAIRGDKDNRHINTSDDVIAKLRSLFGSSSSLRQHLEEKWKLLREFSSEHPDDEQEISKKRRLLGEAFANGFPNERISTTPEDFDADKWEEAREKCAEALKCPATLKYVSADGEITERDVLIDEVFTSNSSFYLLAYCNLRKQTRTFRVSRIHGIHFHESASPESKSIITNVLFQGAST